MATWLQQLGNWNTNTNAGIFGGENTAGIVQQASGFGKAMGSLGINASNIGGIANSIGNLATGLLAGQNQTGIGNAMQTIGGLASNIPGVGGLIGAGVSVVGGLVNAAFGSHINDEFVNQTNQQANALGSTIFNANTNSDLLNDWQNMTQQSHVSKSEVGSDGWFSNKASRRTRELNDRIDEANLRQLTNFNIAAQNVDTKNDFRILQNMAAYGGPIGSFRKFYAKGGYLEQAKALIRQNEGFRDKPYNDAPKGKNWRSVGYGFNDSGFRDKYPEGISKHYEHGITKKQAEEELDYFLKGAEKQLKNIYGSQWNSFTDSQKAAILDTYYQRPASVGKTSRFYKAVTAGEDPSRYLGVAGFTKRNNIRQNVFGGGEFTGVGYSDEYNPNGETGEITYPSSSSLLEATSPYFDLSGVTPTQAVNPTINLPTLDTNFLASFGQSQPAQQAAPTVGTVEDFLASYGDFEQNLFKNGGNLFEGGGYKTTGGAGYVPNYDLIEGTKKAVYNYLTGNLPVEEVRSRLYENISPIGYTDAAHRFIEAVRKNKPDEFVLDDISSGKADERGYSLSRDALWAEYLQIPQNKRHSDFRDSKYVGLQNSKYKPSLSKENINYKALVLPQYMIDGVVKEGSVLPLNTNIVTPAHKKTALGSSLGRYTVGRGYDEKGDYVSYYDKWDLSPFGSAGTKDESMGIGMPVEVYDRIYLDDYYEVPEPTHSTYLPEVTAYGNKKSDGGSIHIKPENRGKFTALKKRTGHSATWFKEHGTPAQKKMATFALNSRHWKHGLGGKLNTYNYGNTFGGGGLFGNETVDTVASFLPVLGTAEDAYQFYKNPSWANAGWLAASLASDVFTGGMASKAIKAWRAANKAVNAANNATRAARKEFRAAKTINGANHTKESGTRVRHAINAAGSAGDTRNAAIKRANDALFGAGIKVGIDQGVNGFLNAVQMDMLPDLSKANGGRIITKDRFDMNMFDFGGGLTHGSEFDTGINWVNEGGSHSENPLGGVPMGVDEEGIPNLVEQDEAIWNGDYVFSKRMKVPKKLRDKYKLPEGATFADAVAKLTKESEERPLDEISRATQDHILGELADSQEEKRMAKAQRAMDRQQQLQDDFLTGFQFGLGGHMSPLGIVPDADNISPFEKAEKLFADGGGIHIDPSKKGTFKAQASKMGMGVQEAASHILAHKENYSPEMVKKAVFAHNFAHAFGGSLFEDGGDLFGEPFLYSNRFDLGGDIKKVQDNLRKNGLTNDQIDEWIYTNKPEWRNEYFHNHRLTNNWQGGTDGLKYVRPQAATSNRKTENSNQAAVSNPQSVKKGAGKTSANRRNVVPFAYDWYRNGSDGTGTPTGFKVDKNGKAYDYTKEYTDLVNRLGADDIRAWAAAHPDDPSLRSFLANGNKLENLTDEQWRKGATDGKYGFMHHVADQIGKEEAVTRAMTDEEFAAEYPMIARPNNGAVTTDWTDGSIWGNAGTTKKAPQQPATGSKFTPKPTWMRQVPIWLSAAMGLKDMLTPADYSNADAITEAAYQAGQPVSVGTEYIGDYRSRDPFDQHYLETIINQRGAATNRNMMNFSGGNRAVGMAGILANDLVTQQGLAEAARQGYIANRTDDAQVSEFNRGTNLANMQAQNTRNLALAQLNSQRQNAMLSGIAQGARLRQAIKDQRDAAISANWTNFAQNMSDWGKENGFYNMLGGLNDEGVLKYFFGDNYKTRFNNTSNV